jgi:hypothetical protein
MINNRNKSTGKHITEKYAAIKRITVRKGKCHVKM